MGARKILNDLIQTVISSRLFGGKIGPGQGYNEGQDGIRQTEREREEEKKRRER